MKKNLTTFAAFVGREWAKTNKPMFFIGLALMFWGILQMYLDYKDTQRKVEEWDRQLAEWNNHLGDWAKFSVTSKDED